MHFPGVDPFEHVEPWMSGAIQADRRQALRGLLGAVATGGAGLAALLAGTRPAQAADSQGAPTLPPDWAKPGSRPVTPGKLPFIHIFAGADRITRVERRDIELSAEPTTGLFIQPAETFAIRVITPGAMFDWHKPSRPRIVAVLRGRATFTLRDGSTGVVLPGTIGLVENMDSDGHRGSFDPDEFTLTVDVGLPMPAKRG